MAISGDLHLLPPLALEPWLEVSSDLVAKMRAETYDDDLRLGVALTRGLLIDVLASGDAAPATRALGRFVEACNL